MKLPAKPRRSILIVEDETEALELVKKRLEREGYKTFTASNGKEGLAVALAQKPDLIILDIIMPEGDGITMLRALKLDDKTIRIPVILLTAKSDVATITEGRHYGAVDYFIKPFEWDQFLRMVRRHLAMQE